MVDLRDEPKTATPASVAALGLRQAIALIVGCIIGVSIFNLPYSLASIGPISLVEMVLTTICALALALMFAALSRRLPADGGPYAHVLAAFGKRRGFRECRRQLSSSRSCSSGTRGMGARSTGT